MSKHKAQSMGAEEFYDWNEKMAQKYDPDDYHRSSNFIVRFIEHARVKKILRLLRVKPEHRVLEVGVGAGNILEMIQAKHRAGVDLSPFLLEKARERLPDAELIEGNAEALTALFPLKSFDRAFCSEVLEHVQDPKKVVAEMAAILKDDGIAVVSIPNEGVINGLKSFLKRIGVFRLLFPAMADHMEDEWHLHVFSKSLLQEVCSESFDIVAIRAAPFFFLPIRYVAKLRPRASVRDLQQLLDPAKPSPGAVPIPENVASQENRVKDFFKRWPKIYAALFAIIGPSLLTGVTSRRFARRFSLHDHILHAGSGSRRLTPQALNVDILPFPGVDVVADLAALPFKNGAFDAVTCEQVLEHVPNPYSVSIELQRVTKPNGLIHIASPFVFPWHASPSDFSRWTLEGLVALFPGCEVVEKGVMAGPMSSLTAFIASFLSVVLSLGIRPVQPLLEMIFLTLLCPLKLLDLLFVRFPGIERCSANLYVIVRTPHA